MKTSDIIEWKKEERKKESMRSCCRGPSLHLSSSFDAPNINEPTSLSSLVPYSFLGTLSLIKTTARCHYVIISLVFGCTAPTAPSTSSSGSPWGSCWRERLCLANEALSHLWPWPSAWPTEPPFVLSRLPHKQLSLPHHHPNPKGTIQQAPRPLAQGSVAHEGNHCWSVSKRHPKRALSRGSKRGDFNVVAACFTDEQLQQ